MPIAILQFGYVIDIKNISLYDNKILKVLKI